MCCAVPETEDDWYQVECILNTLNYAQPQTLEIQSCFLDTAVRTYIVEDFVYTCQRATVLPLWDRITAFCDAPHVALRSINMDTGRPPGDMPYYWLMRVDPLCDTVHRLLTTSW